MSDSQVLTAPAAATRAARRLPRSAGFAVIVAIMVLFQAAASAPAPLYVVYQQMWGFSPATLTLIFAIFVLVLLAALLTLGRLSDYIGRRPVLMAAIAAESAALLLFLVAGWPRPGLMAVRAGQFHPSCHFRCADCSYDAVRLDRDPGRPGAWHLAALTAARWR